MIEAVLRKVSHERNVATRVAALKRGDSIPKFKECLIYAYNPFIRFGIKVTQRERDSLMGRVNFVPSGPTVDVTDAEFWEILDALKNSTESSKSKLEFLHAHVMPRLAVQSAHIMIGILEKSLVVGVQVSTVNKAFPGLIPVFAVQLADKYKESKVKKFPVYVEPKFDGMRATAVIHPTGEVDVFTRTGREIPAATYFHPELRQVGERYRKACMEAGITYKGCVLDGELIGGSFNETISTFRSGEKASSGIFHVFDFLPMRALTENIPATYESRRALLGRMLDGASEMLQVSPAMKAASHAEVWAMYEKARAAGLEGVIVKDPDGLWERKRSKAWLKVKAEETEDLTIIGAFEGEGQMAGTLGGLIVNRKGVEVRVGSGFSADDRDKLWAMFLNDLVEHDIGGDSFQLVGYTVEVQYQEVTKDGSLRHPVFIRLRKDKDEALF
jgi:ATP-dependent DNA ligase